MYRNRRFGNDRGSGGFAPINVGDTIDVTIEAQGEKGDGLAKVKGFVIFVPGAKQGDRVKVKINKVLKKVGFAEIVGKASEGSEAQESTEQEYSESSESDESSGSSESEDKDSYESSEDSQEATEDSEDFGEEGQ